MARGRILVLIALAIGAATATSRAQPEGARRPAPPPPPPKAPVMTKAPVLLQAVAPVYPPAALAAGKTADVKVRLHIDATGVVTEVDVVTPVGDGFDEAARAAALQYVFDPAEFDGTPGPITVETTIHFVINQEPAPPPPPPPPAEAAEPPPLGHAGNMKAPITIRGEVLELGTRKRLPGTIVSVEELGLDAITDDRGTFAFHGVAPGAYHLIVAAQHYDRARRAIDLAQGEVLDLKVRLRPSGGNPYETVVEGEREVIEVTRRKLVRQQMTTVPGTFGDPIRAIQALPGLARAPFGVGVLIIRGSNPDDTGIFIDGHRVPGIFHFLGGPSILNPEFVDSLDLYPGGFPARFGRLHGGVVAIETRPSKSDGVHGSASVDVLNASGYVRAPITKHVSIALAARRSYLDFVLGLLLPAPGAGEQRVVVPYYYDGQARIDWDLGKDGHASVLGLVSSDQLRVVNSTPDEAASFQLNSSIDFFRIIGTYERPLAGDLKLTLSPAYGRDQVVFSGSQAQAMGPYSSFGITEDTLSYRMRVRGRLDPRAYLDSGLDYESRVTTYDILAAVSNDFRNSGTVNLPSQQINRGTESIGLGAHADVALDLGKLRLIPGLRWDGYILGGQTRASIDPRLVARYAVDPMWTAKAYLGVYHEPPQPEAFDQRFGNPNVGLERGIHAGVGVEASLDRTWKADAEVYLVRRTNLVAFTQDVTVHADGSVTPIVFQNSGDGWTYGFEALIRRELTERAYGWLSYTYSHSQRRLAPDLAYAPTPFDQPHVLNAVASYKIGKGWELGARLRLASGSPDTTPTGATYDADLGQYVAVTPGFRTGRAPFFQQTDVRAEKTWLFATWSLGVYLDVQNVFNTHNVEAVQYDYRFQQRADITGVPFLPTLGIRGSW